VARAARSICEVILDHQDDLLVIYQNTHLLDDRAKADILSRVTDFVRFFEGILKSASAQAGVPLQDSFLAANILTYLPTMIALRRWAIPKDAPRDFVVGYLSDFLVRGIGLPAGAAPAAGNIEG
jgi:hypothetical protein